MRLVWWFPIKGNFWEVRGQLLQIPPKTPHKLLRRSSIRLPCGGYCLSLSDNFKRDWKFQASHPPRPLFCGECWRSRLNNSSEIDFFKIQALRVSRWGRLNNNNNNNKIYYCYYHYDRQFKYGPPTPPRFTIPCSAQICQIKFLGVQTWHWHWHLIKIRSFPE